MSFHVYIDEPLIKFSRVQNSVYGFLEKEKVTASNVGKSIIVIGTESGKVLYFNPDMCELNELKKHHSGRVTSLSIDKEELVIVSGSLDGFVYIHTIATGNCVEINLKAPVTSMVIDPAFSAQQRHLIVGTSTGLLKYIAAKSNSFKERILYNGTTAVRATAWQGRGIAFADGERCAFMDLDEDVLIDISAPKSIERDTTPNCSLYWSGRLLFIGWEDTVEVVYFFNSSRDTIPITGLPSVVTGEVDLQGAKGEGGSEFSNNNNNGVAEGREGGDSAATPSARNNKANLSDEESVRITLGSGHSYCFNVAKLEITTKLEEEAIQIIKKMFDNRNGEGDLIEGDHMTSVQSLLTDSRSGSAYIPILISRFRLVAPKLVIKSIGIFEDNILLLVHPSVCRTSMMLQQGIKRGDIRSPYEYHSSYEYKDPKDSGISEKEQGDLNPLPQLMLSNLVGVELSSYRLDVKDWGNCTGITMHIPPSESAGLESMILDASGGVKSNVSRNVRGFGISILSTADLILGKKITIEDHCLWLCKERNYDEAKDLVLEYNRPRYIEEMRLHRASLMSSPSSSSANNPSSQQAGTPSVTGDSYVVTMTDIGMVKGGKTFSKQFAHILEKCAKGFLNNHEYWKAAQTLSLILPLEGGISDRDRLWEQWVYTFISFNALQYLVEFMPGFSSSGKNKPGAASGAGRGPAARGGRRGRRRELELDESQLIPTNNRIPLDEAKPLQLSSGCMLSVLASLLASSHYFFNRTLYSLKHTKVLMKTQSFNLYYKSIIAAIVERQRKFPHDVNIQETLAMLYHLNGQHGLSLVYRVLSSDSAESMYNSANIFKYIKKNNLYDDAVSLSGELFQKFPEASTAFFKNCTKESFDKILYLTLMTISYNSINAPYQKYTDDTIIKRVRGAINVGEFVTPIILFMIEVNKIDRVFINTALGRAENKVNTIISDSKTALGAQKTDAQEQQGEGTSPTQPQTQATPSAQTSTETGDKAAEKKPQNPGSTSSTRKMNVSLKQTTALNTKIANAITKIIGNVTGRPVRQEVTELLVDNPSNMNEIIPNAIRRMTADHEYTLLCLVAQHDPQKLRSVLDSLTQVTDAVKKQVVKEYRRVEEYVYLLKKENQAQDVVSDGTTDAATYKNNLLLEALDVLLEKQTSDAIDDAVQFVWSVEDSGKGDKGKSGYNITTTSGSVNLWEYLASKCGDRESVSRLLQLAADGKIPLDSIRLVELIDQNLEIDNLSVMFKCILHNADKRQKLWRLCFALVQRDTVELSSTLYNKSKGGILIGGGGSGCAICGKEIISENASNTVIQMDGSVVHEECAGGN